LHAGNIGNGGRGAKGAFCPPITRATPESHAKSLRTIPNVKLPKTDAVMGENGPW
jgi:hypothetical protein